MSIARFKPVAGMNVADVWRNYLFSDKTATAGYIFAMSKAEILAKIPKLTLSYLRLRKRPVVRRILARRFSYRIFYIVRTDAIVVFAVLHTARHDRHWKQRV